MKKFYDADYIIRKNNEYEELEIYNNPVEIKLRKMIEEATKACEIQNEKCRLQKEKLEAKRRERMLKEQQTCQQCEEPAL